MHRLTLLLGCCWLLALATPCSAKEWRNISPLKTTRAEVMQLLGEPKYSQPSEQEYFEVDNQIITIRWTRPDCHGENAFIDGGSLKLLLQNPDGQSQENADINEGSAGMDALVFQVTVVPKVPLKSIDSEDSSKSGKVPDSKISGKRTKAELKELYRSWMSQVVDCTIGANGRGWCTIFNTEKGFGYHESKAGVTALYYFPTDEELQAWNQSHKPCSQ